ncbi:hypothetical protein SAMN04489760_14713 [Syntrophus gentianae]|uniref:Uncharacterized protein n=1 Tax=Syntrophus gentianae TaxID=43775 RepID=A0A1H8B731_9BACT|nr:hypothetical protein [Syntrophus gentianae]SEM78536.1 hypothetical protein SAMN04489760_14713 [Syntrophus gentianae]
MNDYQSSERYLIPKERLLKRWNTTERTLHDLAFEGILDCFNQSQQLVWPIGYAGIRGFHFSRSQGSFEIVWTSIEYFGFSSVKHFEKKHNLEPSNPKTQKETKVTTLQDGGKISKRTKDPIILEAIRLFLEQNPKLKEGKKYTDISSAFNRKYKENTPLCFTFENNACQVYHERGIIHSQIEIKQKNRKQKYVSNSITLNTFKISYIPEVKNTLHG